MNESVDNDNEAFRIAIEETMRHGFYFSGGMYIFKYDFAIDDFQRVDAQVLVQTFNEYYRRQFDNPNTAPSIRADDIIAEVPIYENIKYKFGSYKLYRNAYVNRINLRELEFDLKPYIEKNDGMKESADNYIMNNNKDILHLINNDIFIDGSCNRGGYWNLYKYDRDDKKFILLTSDNIFDFINPVSNDNPSYWLEIVPRMIVNANTVEQKQIVSLGNIISRFNQYHEIEETLKSNKDNFIEINELINSFKA